MEAGGGRAEQFLDRNESSLVLGRGEPFIVAKGHMDSSLSSKWSWKQILKNCESDFRF